MIIIHMPIANLICLPEARDHIVIPLEFSAPGIMKTSGSWLAHGLTMTTLIVTASPELPLDCPDPRLSSHARHILRAMP